MVIRRANTQDETQIRRLLDYGRRVYANFGREDLSLLLERQVAFLAADGAQIWGFVGIEVEERPATLPATAADRAYLRTLALAVDHPPARDAMPLLRVAIQELRQRPPAKQLIVYGGESWLIDVLPDAGFVLTDQVQFFRLSRLQHHPPTPVDAPTAAELRPMQPNDIDGVAQLDASAFEPLWHYGAKELWELLFSCWMQVASLHDRLVGYAAVSLVNQEAHLVRLAVHPYVQGQGFGRQLLLQAIDYAHTARATTMSLNTQVSNTTAQQFYRRFGFQPTRHRIPVLTQIIQPNRSANGASSP
jgi:ribosomal-protein-alanine N-acetyltransferase